MQLFVFVLFLDFLLPKFDPFFLRYNLFILFAAAILIIDISELQDPQMQPTFAPPLDGLHANDAAAGLSTWLSTSILVLFLLLFVVGVCT